MCSTSKGHQAIKFINVFHQNTSTSNQFFFFIVSHLKGPPSKQIHSCVPFQRATKQSNSLMCSISKGTKQSNSLMCSTSKGYQAIKFINVFHLNTSTSNQFFFFYCVPSWRATKQSNSFMCSISKGHQAIKFINVFHFKGPQSNQVH